ncbi:hypothetical protein OL233_11090 [Vagococcus sp. PNs007]|uniref:Uncharacterized protein n=1 Tax=Vagococcus proximus TaxID=2991417 RepID=A0ABT5X498_9ENTE|nr:hypothetical protein [Vagococcus proximus]MDF0480824.1 hypothetical protein [Vagococcus proximus]
MLKKLLLIGLAVLMLVASFGAGAYGTRVYLERENAKSDRKEESSTVERLSAEIAELATYSEMELEADKLPLSVDVMSKKIARIYSEVSDLSDGQLKKESLLASLKRVELDYEEKVKAAEELKKQQEEQRALEETKQAEALKEAEEKRKFAERELEEAKKREQEYKIHVKESESTRETEKEKSKEDESLFKIPKIFTKGQAKTKAEEWYEKEHPLDSENRLESQVSGKESDSKGTFWTVKGQLKEGHRSRSKTVFEVKVYDNGEVISEN